jgi:hypothetical protein
VQHLSTQEAQVANQLLAPIEKIFKPLIGQPAWHVKQGHGSFLTFEFGKPHLEISQPTVIKQRYPHLVKETEKKRMRRTVQIHGDWSLWIYCCAWAISQDGNDIAESESSNEVIKVATDYLDGQALLNVIIEPESVSTSFQFDLGGRLQTWPDDTDGEQWFLFKPDGKVLTIRADGRYSHHPANETSENEVWRSVWDANHSKPPQR